MLPLVLLLLGDLGADVAPILERTQAPKTAHGLVALLSGNKAAARLALVDDPQLATYLAMAELEGAGGMGRAREVLAKASRAESAPTGALFLAALAFHVSGDRLQADRLLARALAQSKSVLEESFAPDPAAALVRLVEAGASAPDKIELARMLLTHGRRSEAIRLAESIDARAVLVEAWAPIDPRRALRYADDPAWTARLEWKLGEKEKAKAALQTVKTRSAEVERLRAELLLDDQKASEALAVAQEAARLDPKSDDAVRMVAEALFATQAYDRAGAFAEELLRRKPVEIDPYGLLARIQAERRHTREVAALEARSKGHQLEREKVAKARRRREAMIAAVRDAESGLGTTGLEAMRASDPPLSLPIDLALAKLGPSGTARAARDRVLAACSDDLAKLLAFKGGAWDRVRIDVSPYGKAQKVDVPLSAADPGRCGGRVLRK